MSILVKPDIDAVYHVSLGKKVACGLVSLLGIAPECASMERIERLLDIGSFCPVCYNELVGINYRWDILEEYTHYLRTSSHIRTQQSDYMIFAGVSYRVEEREDGILFRGVPMGGAFSIHHSWQTPDGMVAVIRKPRTIIDKDDEGIPAVYAWGTMKNQQFFVVEAEIPFRRWHACLTRMMKDAADHAMSIQTLATV